MFFLFFFVGFIAACTSSSLQQQSSEMNHTEDYRPAGVAWHRGNIEAAFKLARTSQKKVFVYWGARWCPTCNEMKSQILNRPEFAQSMKDFVSVYLDGDQDYAQSWGEYFQMSAYPTVLILDADKRELIRIHELIDLKTFVGLAKQVAQGGADLPSILAKADVGQIDEPSWLLLEQANWSESRSVELHKAENVKRRLKLWDLAGPQHSAARASLAAGLLEAAIRKPPSLDTESLTLINKQAADLIASLMTDDQSIYAARGLMVYQARAVLEWAFPNDREKRQLLAEKWLASATRLRAHPQVTIDLQIWSYYPSIVVHEMNKGKTPLPEGLRTDLSAIIRSALPQLTTPIEKQAILPGAAFLLAKAGLFEDAYALLQDHQSDAIAPFYFRAAMARVADLQGQSALKKKYLEESHRMVKGRATRVQWAEQVLGLQLSMETQKEKQLQAIRDFYDAVFLMRDGFSGRSYRSVKSVTHLIQPIARQAGIQEALKAYSYRCNKLTAKEKYRCDDHFTLLSAPAS